MDMQRTLALSKHGHSPYNRTLGEGRETNIEEGALGALGLLIQDKTVVKSSLPMTNIHRVSSVTVSVLVKRLYCWQLSRKNQRLYFSWHQELQKVPNSWDWSLFATTEIPSFVYKTPVSVVIQSHGHKMSLIMFLSAGDRRQETGDKRQGRDGMYGILFAPHTLVKHKEEMRCSYLNGICIAIIICKYWAKQGHWPNNITVKSVC